MFVLSRTMLKGEKVWPEWFAFVKILSYLVIGPMPMWSNV